MGRVPSSLPRAQIARRRILGGTPTPTPFTPAVPRQTPSGATINVNSGMASAVIAAAYATASPGDAVLFAAGTYDQNACFPLGFNRAGVIVGPQTWGASDSDPMGGGNGPHHARFTRNVTFLYKGGIGGTTSSISANNITIQGILHKTDNATLWPANNANWISTCAAATTGGWGMLSIAANVTGTAVLYNEFSMGYGTSADQIDPTNKYIDCNSPATFDSGAGGILTTPGGFTGWGDGTWVDYNRLLWGPYAICGASSRVGAGLTIYGNYFHDMSHGFTGLLPAGGAFLEQHNWMERIYHDYGTLSTANTTAPSTLVINNNVWIDPFGHPKDNGNPHSDTDQMYWSLSSPGTVRPTGIQASRNLLMNTSETVRGAAQYHFLQMSADHYAATNDVISIAPKLRENIAIMSGSSHGTDLAVSEDPYYRGNEVFHPATLNNGSTVTSAALTVDSAHGISTGRTNKGFYADNVMEGAILTSSGATAAVMQQTNDATMGSRTSRSIAESALFTGNPAAWPGATPHAVFEYRKKQPAYATLGNQQANIAAFLLATPDWTGERPFAGFADSLGQVAGNVITSNPAWIHGGDPGDTLAIAPTAGVEWRTLLTDRTTQNQAWSSSSGSVVVDSGYLQVRATAPTQGTSTTFNPTLGGVAMPWLLGSASTVVFPGVVTDGTNYFKRTATTGAIGSNSQMATIAINMKTPASLSTTTRLFGDDGNLVFQINISGTTGRLSLTAKNSAGTTILAWTGGVDVRDGLEHIFLWKIDMSQVTSAAGFAHYDNGVASAVSPTTYNTSGTESVFFGKSTTTHYMLGGNNAATIIMPAWTLRYAYLDCVNALDISVGANRSKFNADQILSDGSGPTGAQPVFFLIGNATQFEANAVHPTGAQWGSGTAWSRLGTNAVTNEGAGTAWS